MRTSLSLSTLVAVAAVSDALTLPVSTSLYAPVSVTCPSTSLVRPANGLNSDEAAYKKARKAVADIALKKWLAKTHSGFCVDDITLPTVKSLFQVIAHFANRIRSDLQPVVVDIVLCCSEAVSSRVWTAETATSAPAASSKL